MGDFFESHTTDSVLGRTGTTIDWPNSIPDFDPASWDNYVHHPPTGSTWQEFLGTSPQLVARNAVKPFAVFHEHGCNLLLVRRDIEPIFGDLSDTFSDVSTGKVSFGKRIFDYLFCSLRTHSPLAEDIYSPENVFSTFDTSRLHIHGTRVVRGEETTNDCPLPLETNRQFQSFDEFCAAQRALTLRLNRLAPTHLEIKASPFPLAFSTPVDLYFNAAIAKHIAEIPNAGVAFPFAPISVSFAET